MTKNRKSPPTEPNTTSLETKGEKKPVIKAVLIGLACGVMFMLTAKFVSLVIN